jgi:energy-coupling factor transport system permease protein
MDGLSRINPLAKFGGAALLTAAAWLASRSLAVEVGLAAGLLAVAVVCRIPRLKGFLGVMALVGGLVTGSWALNFLWHGQGLLPAFVAASRLALRLISTATAFFIAIESTSAGALAAACCRCRFPTRLTLTLVLVVGLIPLLRDEFLLIGETQRARGLELDRGSLGRRALHALARGVPLLVQTYRMAEAISIGICLQGFDLRTPRTTWRRVGWLTIDSRFPFDSKD